jgi:hypothetical protein
MEQFIIFCDGGLANRIRCLVSGISVAEILGLDYLVIWPCNNRCGASYEDLLISCREVSQVKLQDFLSNQNSLYIWLHENDYGFREPVTQLRDISGIDELKALYASEKKSVLFCENSFLPWLPDTSIDSALRKLTFRKDIIEKATRVISENTTTPFFGIHLRATDFPVAPPVEQMIAVVAANSHHNFFVCSDDKEIEGRFAVLPNAFTNKKDSYVEKMESGEWRSDILDSDGIPYTSNINRTGQSVIEASIDLLILSASTPINTSQSSFLALAHRLQSSGFTARHLNALPLHNYASEKHVTSEYEHNITSEACTQTTSNLEEVVSRAEVIEIYKLIWPWNLVSDHKSRFGSSGDGGYVLPSFVCNSNRLLSIGIGGEVSLDLEMANMGATVLQFDHTVEGPPQEHPNFQFYRKGWGEQDSNEFLSLHSMMSMFDWHEAKHPILKFDVEFAEWGTLASCTSEDLARFEVITGEFHGFQYLADRSYYELFLAVLEKLAMTHNPIHLHANNAGGEKTVAGVKIPQFLEITYLRKDMGAFDGYSTAAIPGPLDQPNWPQIPDIVISPYFDLETGNHFAMSAQTAVSSLLEGPVEWGCLSEEVQKRFTLNSRIPLYEWFLRETSPGKVGKHWPRSQILNGIFQACRRGDLDGIRSYDPKSVYDLYKVLDQYSVAYKDVLIIGSQRPWIEVCCLAFGAKSVTTVDFNPPVAEYPEIRTVSVEQFEKESRRYDILISFSSLEHDGLGRYGDPIDPEGDLKRMASYLNIVKPDGYFFLGVPCGRDALYWNAHRIYGEIRFAMLTEKWNLLEFFLEGFSKEDVFKISEDYEHAWWVLSPRLQKS